MAAEATEIWGTRKEEGSWRKSFRNLHRDPQILGLNTELYMFRAGLFSGATTGA